MRPANVADLRPGTPIVVESGGCTYHLTVDGEPVRNADGTTTIRACFHPEAPDLVRYWQTRLA